MVTSSTLRVWLGDFLWDYDLLNSWTGAGQMVTDEKSLALLFSGWKFRVFLCVTCTVGQHLGSLCKHRLPHSVSRVKREVCEKAWPHPNQEEMALLWPRNWNFFFLLHKEIPLLIPGFCHFLENAFFFFLKKNFFNQLCFLRVCDSLGGFGSLQ